MTSTIRIFSMMFILLVPTASLFGGAGTLSIPSFEGQLFNLEYGRTYKVILKLAHWKPASNQTGMEQVNEERVVVDVDDNGVFVIPKIVRKSPIASMIPLNGYWWTVDVDVISVKDDWEPTAEDFRMTTKGFQNNDLSRINDVIGFLHYLNLSMGYFNPNADRSLRLDKNVGYFSVGVQFVDKNNYNFVKTDLIPALKEISLNSCQESMGKKQVNDGNMRY